MTARAVANRSTFANRDVRNPTVNTSYWSRYNVDTESGLVYASDMKINYGARVPISDANPTGSRVPSTGLVLSWDGHTTRNGKAKNFADPSGNTDGVASGGVAIGGATGIRGAGTSFDGVDDQIRFPALFTGSIGQGAIGGWFYADTSESAYIFSHGGTSPLIWMLNGIIRASHFGATGMPQGSGKQTNTYALAAGWHFAIFTWTASGYAFYIDNECKESMASGCTFSTPAAAYILSHQDSYLAGTIGDNWFWTRALSNTEVRQLYEDTYGWVQNLANPHCVDISDANPLGTDRVSSQGCLLSIDMETMQDATHLHDFSGAGNHATILGSPKYNRGAIKNGAYALAATDKLSSPPIPQSTTGFTYLAWVKPTTVTGAFYCIFNHSVYEVVTVQSSTGKPFVQIYSSGAPKAMVANTPLVAGQTQFIAFTFDGRTAVAYRNGVPDGSLFLGVPDARAPAAVSLGDGVNTLAGQFGQCGYITHALSADEIQKLFLDGQKMLGLVQGNPSSAPAPVGSAVDLNGTSQYVEVQDCPALSPAQMTAGAWINTDDITAANAPRIFDKLDGSSHGFRLYVGSGATARLGVGGAVFATATSTDVVSLQRWQLIWGSEDGANAKIGIDGNVPVSTGAGAIIAGAMPLRIGAVNGGLSACFDGRIAFPFIFSRALSASEIARLRFLGLSARW